MTGEKVFSRPKTTDYGTDPWGRRLSTRWPLWYAVLWLWVGYFAGVGVGWWIWGRSHPSPESSFISLWV